MYLPGRCYIQRCEYFISCWKQLFEANKSRGVIERESKNVLDWASRNKNIEKGIFICDYRYEREKEAAGFVTSPTTTNGHHNSDVNGKIKI